MTDLAVKFLRTVWAKQAGGTGFVAWKDWLNGGREGDWSNAAVEPNGLGIYAHLTERVTENLNDLYFTPCLFTCNSRRREEAMPSRWLYADLDEVNPRTVRPRPTLAWQTSPNRYQCMWLLDRQLPLRRFEQLNQRMTYYVGADKGGWSVTKVLRVPGSISHKYARPFKVRLLWSSSHAYSVHDLEVLLRDVDSDSTAGTDRVLNPPRSLTAAVVRRRYGRKFSSRVRRLLGTRTVVKGDDRSARLWELENALLDLGLTPTETYVLVKGTVWNKYRGQNREQRMLSAEIQRAARRPSRTSDAVREGGVDGGSDERSKERRTRFNFVRVSDFLTTMHRSPAWLVQGIWSAEAHGMLAGEEKAFKSLLTMDLAVSVASGTPFLNHFRVPTTGPVIIVQEENRPGDVQDRLQRIMRQRGLAPGVVGSTLDFRGADLPLYLVNQEGFELNNTDHLSYLDRRLSRIRPALIVFDPLYLMTPGLDENSAQDMTPVLANLLKLKVKHKCGIQIVHHFNKPNQNGSRRLGQRMSGTGVFSRWYASAVYVESLSDEEGRIRVSTQHRGQGPHFGYTVTFDLGEEGDEDTYGVTVDLPAANGSGRSSDTSGVNTVGDVLRRAGRERASLHSLSTAMGISEDAVRKRASREGLRIARRRVKGGVFKHFVYLRKDE